MDAEWAVFVFALLGAYVQGVTGFAMSMIMLTGVTAVAPVPLSVTTAVVSLASLANIVLSLRGHLRSIAARGFLILLLGQVPFLALGLALLTYLDAQLRAFSELLLGVFIVAGCGAMMLRPVPRETRSTS
ncbi:MAG: TSUP family transporter, partial [Pseudomonadales bacterium]